MSDQSLFALHAITSVVTVVSCLSVFATVAWYLVHARSVGRETIGAVALFGVFVLACGVARLGDLMAAQIGGGIWVSSLDGLAAAVMAIVAVAVWALVPRLVARPSRSDLVAANHRLAEEEIERELLVDRLTGLNAVLEARVAERTRDLAEAKQRFEVALEGSTISVAQQDRDLRYTWVWNLPPHIAPERLLGRVAEDALAPDTAARLTRVKRAVLETGVADRFEVDLPDAAGSRIYEGRVEPLLRDGAVVGVMTVSIDVTRHREAERHLRDLLRELTHRSKNLLAVVQGIARRTAETSRDLPSFTERFITRLHALSHAHELLVDGDWHGAPLREVVLRELGSVLSAPGGRVTITGDVVLLGPEATQNLSLALNELLLNARLHGALAIASGRVAIAWNRTDDDGLAFSWIESGGPRLAPPSRSGFGRRLLERVVPHAVEGEADLVFAEDGLRFSLRVPATRLVAAARDRADARAP